MKLLTLIKRSIHYLFTLVARPLPLWKEAPTTDVLPPILSLPVSLPVNIHQLPEKFAKQFVSVKSIPKQRVFILKNVFVNKDGVVFKNLNVFVPSLPWANDLVVYRRGKLLLQQWMPGKKQQHHGYTAALVFDHWAANNYYHWMIESLPRLMVALHYNPHCKTLIPRPAPQYIQKTLELLNCHATIPLQRDTNEIHFFETLLLPERVYYENTEEDIQPIFRGQQIDKAAHRFDEKKIKHKYEIEHQEPIIAIRNKILDNLALPVGTPKKRIYVSRSRQKTRRLLNEQDILPILNKHGFEVVCFEDIDFENQVKLMQETEIFVGVHGANMVNILFMPEDMKVIELMNIEYMNDAYYQIASSAHLLYYSISCQMADASIKHAHFTKINDADIVIDLPMFENTLENALSK